MSECESRFLQALVSFVCLVHPCVFGMCHVHVCVHACVQPFEYVNVLGWLDV